MKFLVGYRLEIKSGGCLTTDIVIEADNAKDARKKFWKKFPWQRGYHIEFIENY
jgi:DNA-dependent RNA polymerase auxiliary subunit epsilon